MKTKIAGAAGRFGVRYGQSVRRRIAEIEAKQRKKQHCIFCNGIIKRLSKGIWKCKRCAKKFAAHAYFIEEEMAKASAAKAMRKSKLLKKQKISVNEEAAEKKPVKNPVKKPSLKSKKDKEEKSK